MIDSCYSSDDEKLSLCPVAIKDFSVIDSRAWDFCCFRKLNFRGFFGQRNSVSISVQYPNSTAPNLGCDVQKEIVECESFVTLLCGFLGGSCGRDGWGRSTYVICCVAVRSPHRYCHLNSRLYWIHKGRGNFELTSTALESDAPVLHEKS